jgi:hypothetical protein
MRVRTVTTSREIVQIGVWQVRPGRILYFVVLTALASAWVGWPGALLVFAAGCDYTRPERVRVS